jgi:hypothetical protein
VARRCVSAGVHLVGMADLFIDSWLHVFLFLICS